MPFCRICDEQIDNFDPRNGEPVCDRCLSKHGSNPMHIADSFADDSAPTCLDDLSPKEKVDYFVKGLLDNALDLVHFRCAAVTADAVAANEREIYQVLNAVQLVLSSINADKSSAQVAQFKRPTLILVQ